jgi:hypothetical protein
VKNDSIGVNEVPAERCLVADADRRDHAERLRQRRRVGEGLGRRFELAVGRHRADFQAAVGRAFDAAQFFDVAETDDFVGLNEALLHHQDQ